MSNPKVTFGFVNCNRLHYLKSCIESLLVCTDDYPEKELIIVDNASTEPGTDEYLEKKRQSGFTVFKTQKRDPNNEFAKAMNKIVKESTGNYVALLQSDMQFIMKGGWLKRYIDFYEQYPMIGYMCFDAQRRVTNASHEFMKTSDPLLLVDKNRDQFSGAGDALYSRKVLDIVGPWSETNSEHEGVKDSETDILVRVKNMKTGFIPISPVIPVAAMIYTDSRGTNARVRGNRRYGDYWPPKGDNDYEYYAIWVFEKFIQKFEFLGAPMSIEDIAIPVGKWSAPVDSSGSWMKNPIRPETAKESDYVELT